MMKSRVGVCLAAMVSIALMVPATIVSAGQAQAAGGLYTGDCVEALAGAERLAKGLKTLDDMIDRTQRQVDAARNAGGKISREAAKQSEEARKDLAADASLEVLKRVGETKDALEKLARVVEPAQAVSVLKAIKDIKTIEEYYKGVKLTIAAGKWSNALEESKSGMDKVAALGRFLDDAGLTGKLAGMVGGPVASLGVAVGVFAIDTIAADEDAFQNTLDQNRAADTVNLLRQNRGIYQDKISATRGRCMPQPKPTTQNSPLPTPPPDAVAPAAISSGPPVAKIVTLAAVGTGATAGAIIYGPDLISGLGGGPDCSSQLAALNNSVSGLASCGTSPSCANSVIARIISAAGNVCVCMGPTALNASDTAVVRDAFNQLRSLGTNPGNLPACFK